MIEKRLRGLPEKYRELAGALRRDLDISELYLTEYPANVVHGGGCGALGISEMGIDQVEADWIGSQGYALDSRIQQAAKAYGWNYVGGITKAFAGHSYCASHSYFRHFEGSYQLEGSKEGTLHPNHRGHQVIGEHLLHAIVLPRQFPTKRVTITFTQVEVGGTGGLVKGAQSSGVLKSISRERASPKTKGIHVLARRRVFTQGGPSSGTPDPAGVSLWVAEFQNDMPGEHYFRVSALGKWVNLPTGKFTFSFDVYPAPASPRHAVATVFGFTDKGGLGGFTKRFTAKGRTKRQPPTGKWA